MQSVTFTINSDGTWTVLLNGQPVGTVLACSMRYSTGKPGMPPLAMYLLLNNDATGQATMATLAALNLSWLTCTTNAPVTPAPPPIVPPPPPPLPSSVKKAPLPKTSVLKK
jgi:hypothetical protein